MCVVFFLFRFFLFFRGETKRKRSMCIVMHNFHRVVLISGRFLFFFLVNGVMSYSNVVIWRKIDVPNQMVVYFYSFFNILFLVLLE